MTSKISNIAQQIALLAALMGGGSAPAFAGSTQVWAYFGYNYSNNSDITFKPTANSPTVTYPNVGWDGGSFSTKGGPPYYGLRATYWFDSYPGFGAGVDYSHVKVIAQRPPALNALASHFEYTDGLNVLTFDGMYRWNPFYGFRPYVGAGVGLTVPSVEVTLRSPYDTTPTHQYEVGGPAVQGKVGLEYKLFYDLSAFGEYKLAYSWNDVSIRNGGREQDDILTHQLIFGLSYEFK